MREMDATIASDKHNLTDSFVQSYIYNMLFAKIRLIYIQWFMSKVCYIQLTQHMSIWD